MACTDVASNAGIKVYIGAQGDLPTDMAQTNWEAVTSWTEVSEIASLGARGPEDNVIEYKTLVGTICKQKGSVNYGTAEITAADIPTDPGQAAVGTARGTRLSHPFKVVYDDAVTTTSDPTIEYFPALVASWRRNAASDSDSIRERMASLALNNFLEVARDAT
jgi:hypothetical protein